MNIAVLAPMVYEQARTGLSMDYVLRLRTGHELTLNRLHQLARSGYAVEALEPESNYDENLVAAAGYYLEGLLRSAGYGTFLASRIDDATLTAMAASNPFAVCVSSTMMTDRGTLRETIARIRRHMPGVLVIAGGVLVWRSYCAQALLEREPGRAETGRDERYEDWSLFPCRRSDVDADLMVVSPHGGAVLLEVLRELERDRAADLSHIPNLALPDASGEFRFTAHVDERPDFEHDFTRWDLLDELPARIPIRTSIGCPYRCGFCDFCLLYPQIVFRSKASLMAELDMVKRKLADRSGAMMLMFTDDNLFVNSRRVVDVCEAVIESKIKLFCSGFVRAQSIQEDNVRLLKKAGFLMASVGVESGDPDMLERMGKQATVDGMRRGIELLDANGIAVLMTFLVGYPGETAASIANTVAFIDGLATSRASYWLFPLWLSPLSPVSSPESRAEWNIHGLMDTWSHKTMNSEEAAGHCYEMFKAIARVPYHYANESSTFNLRFGYEGRRELFRLRHRLSVELMEGAPWRQAARTMGDIANSMGLGASLPPDGFRGEIVVPSRIRAENAPASHTP